MRTQILLVLTAGLVVGPSPLRADNDKSGVEALQGTWRVISQQRAGRATARPKNMLWIVEGETIWLVPGWLAAEKGRAEATERKKPVDKPVGQKGGKQSGSFRGLPMAFRLDPATSPKQIDIDGPKKSVHCGIYKLDGDEWTVCMGVSQPSPSYYKQAKRDENTRPATLSPEAGTVILLKRVRD